jgi:hypothetical protein
MMTISTLATDITIPAPISEAARQLAGKLGISVGEFYAAALSAYVADIRKRDVTGALNQVYEIEPSTLDPVLMHLQTASLAGERW